MDGGANNNRYNLTFSVSARNVFNNVNLATPIGNLSSPLFGQANGLAGGPYSSSTANRRIDLQVSSALVSQSKHTQHCQITFGHCYCIERLKLNDTCSRCADSQWRGVRATREPVGLAEERRTQIAYGRARLTLLKTFRAETLNVKL